MTRRSKHNAVKLRAYVGTQDCFFDSKAEYRYALWLEREREAGRVDQWVHHGCVFTLHGALGDKVCDLEPDFQVWRVGVEVPEQHEVKGSPEASWRIKRKLYEQEYGREYPYIVIDAGWPDEKNGGPRLFDDRRKNRAAKKKARAAKKGARK